MKTYNRRDFLKLTGMSALALTLAACGGGPSVPAVPSQDAQALLKAINAYREKEGKTPLIRNENLERMAKQDVKCFETAGAITADFSSWYYEDGTTNPNEKYTAIVTSLNNELGGISDGKTYGVNPNGTMFMNTGLCTLDKPFPETEAELTAQMADMLEKTANMLYIGIALVSIGGKPYWYAVMLPDQND